MSLTSARFYLDFSFPWASQQWTCSDFISTEVGAAGTNSPANGLWDDQDHRRQIDVCFFHYLGPYFTIYGYAWLPYSSLVTEYGPNMMFVASIPRSWQEVGINVLGQALTFLVAN